MDWIECKSLKKPVKHTGQASVFLSCRCGSERVSNSLKDTQLLSAERKQT